MEPKLTQMSETLNDQSSPLEVRFRWMLSTYRFMPGEVCAAASMNRSFSRGARCEGATTVRHALHRSGSVPTPADDCGTCCGAGSFTFGAGRKQTAIASKPAARQDFGYGKDGSASEGGPATPTHCAASTAAA